MKTKALFYIILAGALWGTSGIFVHYLAPYGITSVQMSAVRGGVSFLCLAAYALVRDRSLFRAGRRELLLYLGMGVTVFGTATLYYTSMQLTSVSTAVVLMYTAPIYVMIFSVLFLGERLSRGKLLAVGLMLAGCCLVSGIIGGLKFDVLGILLGVLTGIVYAGYNIVTKVAMKQGCKPVSATMYAFFVMGAVAIPVCDPIGLVNGASAEPLVAVPLLIGMGVTTCVLPYFFYTLSMRHLSAGTASALGIVEPMAATLFSVIFLKESIDAFQIVGIALILLAVVFLGREESSADTDGKSEP